MSETIVRFEMAVGGQPVRTYESALSYVHEEWPDVGRWDLWGSHDDGCPSVESGDISLCNCEIVTFVARPA